MATIVIAPDSFKESADAFSVAQAIAQGWQECRPNDTILLHPMADGGEGSMQVITGMLEGQVEQIQVQNPLGQPCLASWGWLPQTATAIIEMASASGIHLVPCEQRNALRASTYGTGELIKAALDKGAKAIVLTLGGSATNDGGAGMLQALGVQLLDKNQQPLAPGGAALAELAQVDLQGLDSRIAQTNFTVACDVTNPLCGLLGASAIFGPQKGATPEQVAMLDEALNHFANICANTLNLDYREKPGAGAAGGTGFAALTFLNATFRPGFELIAELTKLEQKIKQATLVITGEGRMDSQTLHGKVPFGVGRLARSHQVPAVALVGALEDGYQELYAHGITCAFSAASGPMELENSKAWIEKLLQHRAHDLSRLFSAALDLTPAKTKHA